MNDHKLDDLIIGEPSPVRKKSKGLLVVVALIVIILLVGILLSKMILGGSEDQDVLAENNQTEFVSPDLIPMNSGKVQRRKDDLEPIGEEQLPSPRKSIKKSTKKPVPKKIIKRTRVKKPVIKKQVVKKPAPKKQVPKKQVPKKQAPVKPATPKALFNAGKPAYYIQIGAFNRDPNPRFIKKLKSAKLQYVVNKNEKTRRVRVGPYGSYAEAKAALSDVNSSIGIMGFVVKQK